MHQGPGSGDGVPDGIETQRDAGCESSSWNPAGRTGAKNTTGVPCATGSGLSGGLALWQCQGEDLGAGALGRSSMPCRLGPTLQLLLALTLEIVWAPQLSPDLTRGGISSPSSLVYFLVF